MGQLYLSGKFMTDIKKQSEDIRRALDDMRNRLAREHNDTLRYFENASFDQVYRNGFDANKEIIVELVDSLNKAKIYALNPDETVNHNEVAQVCDEALAKVEARLRGMK
jgi:hypothetical protein